MVFAGKKNEVHLKKKRKSVFIISVIILSLILSFLVYSIYFLKDKQNTITGGAIYGPISGLIAYYPLDGNIVDIINGNNGSMINGANCSITGRFGYACNFDGINDYIETPDSKVLSPNTTSQISISFWINIPSFNFKGSDSSGYINFLGKAFYSSPNQCEYLFRVYNSTGFDSVSRSKRVSFYMFNKECGLGSGSYFQDNLVENTWMHVVGVANGSYVFIYKDGVLRDSDPYVGPLAYVNINTTDTNAPFRAGRVQGEYYLNASIDDIKIYNRVLTLSEIQELSSQLPSPANQTKPIENQTVPPVNQTIPSVNQTINCTTSSSCGLISVLKYCSGRKLCTDKLTPTCFNAGTIQSYCSSIKKTSCTNCRLGCLNGACK